MQKYIDIIWGYFDGEYAFLPLVEKKFFFEKKSMPQTIRNRLKRKNTSSYGEPISMAYTPVFLYTQKIFKNFHGQPWRVRIFY